MMSPTLSHVGEQFVTTATSVRVPRTALHDTHTYSMTLAKAICVIVHRLRLISFYILVLFFSVLVISMCGRQIWPALR